MAQSKTPDRAADSATAEAERKPKRISKRKAVEALVRSYFEAMNRRDVPAMGRHWRHDGVEEILPVGILRGRDEIEEFFKATFAAVPDVETTLGRLVAGDRSAAVEWRMEGTFDGEPFQGIDPTGKHVQIRGFDLIEIEGGKFVSNTAYYDGMAFARQVGMMPAQDSGAERALKGAFNAVTRARRTIAERTGS